MPENIDEGGNVPENKENNVVAGKDKLPENENLAEENVEAVMERRKRESEEKEIYRYVDMYVHTICVVFLDYYYY